MFGRHLDVFAVEGRRRICRRFCEFVKSASDVLKEEDELVSSALTVRWGSALVSSRMCSLWIGLLSTDSRDIIVLIIDPSTYIR